MNAIMYVLRYVIRCIKHVINSIYVITNVLGCIMNVIWYVLRYVISMY
jgi:hypothetical protein